MTIYEPAQILWRIYYNYLVDKMRNKFYNKRQKIWGKKMDRRFINNDKRARRNPNSFFYWLIRVNPQVVKGLLPFSYGLFLSMK